jgi:hypothetical protein
MRRFGWLAAAAAALVATVLSPREADADTMDPALARLVTDESCRTPGTQGGLYYNPSSGYARCPTDDVAFAKLIAQWGFALAPTAMHPARSTGYGGFDLAIEGAYTNIDKDARYWQLGTQGKQDPTNLRFSVLNTNPDPFIQVYNLKTRYGFAPLSLPLGLLGVELGTKIGFQANSNIGMLGADVRIALIEGFRTGWPAIFPDLAVGGSVTTITGNPEFQMTIAGADAQLSKPIPIAGSLIITPYVGYSFIRIFGDSGLIDMTPNTDALNYCGYQGSNTPATPDPSKTYRDGQPVCGAGTSADFNNTAVFDPVRMTRHRIDAGLQFRFQMVRIGGHFVTDIIDPVKANQDDGSFVDLRDPNNPGQTIRENKFEGLPKQYTLAFDVGLVL